jgi:hypothetical protein
MVFGEGQDEQVDACMILEEHICPGNEGSVLRLRGIMVLY